MARQRPTLVLVRLKLRLLRAGMQLAGMRGNIAFGFAYVLAVGVGLLGAVGFAAMRSVDAGQAGDVTQVVFAGLFFAWVGAPLLFAAVENTLDVDRLALFPLSARDMMPGLLLASMIGFGGLGTALALAGGVAGLAPTSGLAVVTVLAFGLFLASCVAGSRVASTWLTAVARKRRWRDLALTVGPLIGVLFSVCGQIAGSLSDGDGSGGSEGQFDPSAYGFDDGPDRLPSAVRMVLRVLPSGPAGTAVAAARQGRAADAVVAVVAAGAVLAALLWLWWRAVNRVMTTVPESAGPRAAGTRAGRRRAAIFPRSAWWLPSSRVGAVAAKELRQMVRDPRQRGSLIVGAFAAVFPLVSLQAGGMGSGAVVLAAAFAALLLGALSINAYGYDGPAFWTLVAAGDDARSDLVGKNVSVAVVAGVFVVLDSLVLAVASGGWGWLVPTWGLAAWVLGVEVGLGNLLSVRNPVPMPESSSNVWAQNMSQGMAAVGPAILSMLATAVAVGPFAVATLVLHDSVLGAAAVVATEVGLALVVWRIGLNAAVRRSAGRQADLLAKLDARRAA